MALSGPEPTQLARKIKAAIEAGGPITVADYFERCLADPDHGYYRTREPFGVEGDFITAPEVTQLFGEMIGIFLIGAWRAGGTPRRVRLVEIGPGRGTLMSDVLRVMRQVAPEMFSAADIHLVETSERLAAIQKATLAGSGKDDIAWHPAFEDVPEEGYALVVANEFFDALPIRQFVMRHSAFRERLVGLDGAGGLAFEVAADAVEGDLLPRDAQGQPDATVFETAPVREAAMAAIARRIAQGGGVALAIDYGHIVSGYGDTLQAMRRQAFDDPLAHPGEADLTSHVDFEALSRAARGAGGHVAGLARQGDFLVGLGLLERAGGLGTGKSAAVQEAISEAVERIAGTGAGRMGELFKVLAIADRPLDLPPFRRRT